MTILSISGIQKGKNGDQQNGEVTLMEARRKWKWHRWKWHTNGSGWQEGQAPGRGGAGNSARGVGGKGMKTGESGEWFLSYWVDKSGENVVFGKKDDMGEPVSKKIYSQRSGEIQAMTSRTGRFRSQYNWELTKGLNPVPDNRPGWEWLLTLSKDLIEF